MSLPEPAPGLVIRYDYLWSHEAAAGIDQGKDRPACLVAASDNAASPRFVVLLPITHTAPTGDSVGIEIPPKVKAALGLDHERSWVIVSEHNVDEWPNASLALIPGRGGQLACGFFLPLRLFAAIKAAFLDLARRRRSRSVKR